LFGDDFNRFIIGKYGSLATAQATVKNYYKIIREASVLNDGTRLERYELAVDLTTYNSLSPTVRRSESAYDWEIEQNENRKQIRLLEPRYVSQAIDEVETILQEV